MLKIENRGTEQEYVIERLEEQDERPWQKQLGERSLNVSED